MAEIRQTRDATADLLEIWVHYAEEAGLDVADSVHSAFEQLFDRLLAFLTYGRRRPEFGTDHRSSVCGDYVVIYRTPGDAIEILRVLHGARDIKTITGDDAGAD